MKKHSVRLADDEKWRIEVDVNYLEQLRLLAGVPICKLAQLTGVSYDTYARILVNGEATLRTIARIATYYNVQPGEMLVWMPVPKDFPDHPRYGVGRFKKNTVIRRRPGMPKRALKRWRASEDEQVISLRAAGFTWREIAARLRRTPGAARDRWYTLTERERNAQQTETDEGTGPQVD